MANKSVQTNSKVTIITANTKKSYLLVKSEDIDLIAHKISINSPLGKALLNKKVNEKIWVKTPIGKTKYQIIAID